MSVRTLYVIENPNYDEVCPTTARNKYQLEKIGNIQWLKFTLVFCKSFTEGLNRDYKLVLYTNSTNC